MQRQRLGLANTLSAGSGMSGKDVGSILLRLVGVGSLLLLLFANPIVLRPRFWSASDVARSIAIDATLLIVGTGLIFLRKWAALLSSAIASILAAQLLVAEVKINLVWLLPLLLPIVLTTFSWRGLVWGDKRRDLIFCFAAVISVGFLHYIAFLLATVG
jgi:hypothetical protein